MKAIAFVLAVLTVAVPVDAAVYSVTKTADTNDGVCNADCSLREAVIAANADPGSTIVLQPLATYQLALGPADSADALVAGSGDLDITAPVVIIGNQAVVRWPPGGAIDRVLDIDGTFSATFNDLSVAIGNAAPGPLSHGGAIRIRGAFVTMNNGSVIGSVASGVGGAIAVIGSYSVPDGGVVLAALTLNNTVVQKNSALNGGAIACVLCTLHLSGASLAGNTASGDGGGIAVFGNASSVSVGAATWLSFNQASGRGGGLSFPVGTGVATLTRATIMGNTAATGSALFNGAAVVTATNNWWGCNSGPGAGGAGCNLTPNAVSGPAATSPHLVLRASALPTTVIAGTATVVTADLTFNSDGADTSSGGYLHPGTAVSFSGTQGTFPVATVLLTNGKASNPFTAGLVESNPLLTVSVDNQSVSTPIAIVTLPTFTAVPQGTTIDPGQTASVNAAGSGTGPLQYQWYRGSSGVTTAPVGMNANSYTTPALFGTTRYWLRLSNAYGSADSADAAIVVRFSDETLVPASNMIRAIHVSELRTRVDLQRARFGLAAFAWTDSVLTAGMSSVRAQHIAELRTALAAVYAAAAMTPPTYTDPGLGAGTTMIRAVHVAELRAALAAIE